MTRTHQLETTLRALKLSGMLETIEARLTQARAGDLGHVEFLQALCEDEISRRDQAAVSRRGRAARFDQTAAIEDFNFNYNPKIPAAVMESRHLEVLGGRGVGHLARPGRGGKDHDRRRPRPAGLPQRTQRYLRQDHAAFGRPRRGPCRSQLAEPSQALGEPGAY